MKLINTIEFSPFRFTDNEYEFPRGSLKEMPTEWNKFWQKCLADSNLENLTPVKEGYYHVDVETITDFMLEVLIKKELEDVDLDEYEDQISKIDGGIFIEENNDFLVTSNCCGSLSDLSDWIDILNSKIGIWQQLWIGHPWIFFKRNQEIVEFSDYSEEVPYKTTDIQTKFVIPENWLRSELLKIQERQTKLTQRIEQILIKLNINNSKRISELMTGIES
jgi:hypothetical protein